MCDTSLDASSIVAPSVSTNASGCTTRKPLRKVLPREAQRWWYRSGKRAQYKLLRLEVSLTYRGIVCFKPTLASRTGAGCGNPLGQNLKMSAFRKGILYSVSTKPGAYAELSSQFPQQNKVDPRHLLHVSTEPLTTHILDHLYALVLTESRCKIITQSRRLCRVEQAGCIKRTMLVSDAIGLSTPPSISKHPFSRAIMVTTPIPFSKTPIRQFYPHIHTDRCFYTHATQQPSDFTFSPLFHLLATSKLVVCLPGEKLWRAARGPMLNQRRRPRLPLFTSKSKSVSERTHLASPMCLSYLATF